LLTKLSPILIRKIVRIADLGHPSSSSFHAASAWSEAYCAAYHRAAGRLPPMEARRPLSTQKSESWTSIRPSQKLRDLSNILKTQRKFARSNKRHRQNQLPNPKRQDIHRWLGLTVGRDSRSRPSIKILRRYTPSWRPLRGHPETKPSRSLGLYGSGLVSGGALPKLLPRVRFPPGPSTLTI